MKNIWDQIFSAELKIKFSLPWLKNCPVLI